MSKYVKAQANDTLRQFVVYVMSGFFGLLAAGDIWMIMVRPETQRELALFPAYMGFDETLTVMSGIVGILLAAVSLSVVATYLMAAWEADQNEKWQLRALTFSPMAGFGALSVMLVFFALTISMWLGVAIAFVLISMIAPNIAYYAHGGMSRSARFEKFMALGPSKMLVGMVTGLQSEKKHIVADVEIVKPYLRFMRLVTESFERKLQGVLRGASDEFAVSDEDLQLSHDEIVALVNKVLPKDVSGKLLRREFYSAAMKMDQDTDAATPKRRRMLRKP